MISVFVHDNKGLDFLFVDLASVLHVLDAILKHFYLQLVTLETKAVTNTRSLSTLAFRNLFLLNKTLSFCFLMSG